LKKKHRNVLFNLILPAVVFGSITGALTAVIVTLYKLCAKYVIGLSESGYRYLANEPLWIPLVLAGMFGLAFLYAFGYRNVPNLRGGGIPTSIGILRGLITFKWLRTLWVFLCCR